jgi:hypothetical protein
MSNCSSNCINCINCINCNTSCNEESNCSSKAYDLGWQHGYNDQLPDNPYPTNSKEYREYTNGYKNGANS